MIRLYNEDNRPFRNHNFKHEPVLHDAIVLKKTGSWPNGKLPDWVQERLDFYYLGGGEQFFYVLALEFYVDKLLKLLHEHRQCSSCKPCGFCLSEIDAVLEEMEEVDT